MPELKGLECGVSRIAASIVMAGLLLGPLGGCVVEVGDDGPSEPAALRTQALTENDMRRWPMLLGNNLYAMPYYSNQALEHPNSNARRAIIAIHGHLGGAYAGEGARRQIDKLTTAAESAAQLGAFRPDVSGSAPETLLFAPVFLNGTEGHLLGVVDGTPPLLWWSGGWGSGKHSRSSDGWPRQDAVTSFEVIDRMLGVLSNRQRYPLLNEIILIGHSKGGRFVQRYGAVNQVHEQLESAGIALRYIPANPGSFMFPNAQRPVATPCAVANDYPEGLAFMDRGRDGSGTGYVGEKDVEPGDVHANMQARRFIYLAGEEDNLRHSDAAQTYACQEWVQGPGRIDRALSFHAALGDEYGSAIYQNHQLVTVPEAGHSSNIYTRADALGAIFDVDVPFDTSLKAPLGTADSSLPRYEWYAAADATWYQLVALDEQSWKENQILPAAAVGCQFGGLCALNASQSLAVGNVLWGVRPWNPTALWGAWPMDGGSIAFDPARGLDGFAIAPPAGAQSLAVEEDDNTLRWDTVDGARFYRVEIRDTKTDMTVLDTWLPAEQLCGIRTRCQFRDGRFNLASGSFAFTVTTWNFRGLGPSNDLP